MHFRAIHVARFQVRHAERFFRRLARDRKCRRILFIQRQIIGGMTEAEQTRGVFFLSRPIFSIYFPETSTTDAEPSVICEQSETFSGGATLGFLSETWEA